MNAVVPAEQLPEILAQYISGKPVKHLALELGITQQSLSERLRKAFGPNWQELKEHHWETRLDDGLDRLELAESDPVLARTREAILRRIEWRASVECRERYGQQQIVAPAVQVAVQINLKRGEGETNAAHHAIDVDAEVGEQS
jgi:hypothetical protein